MAGAGVSQQFPIFCVNEGIGSLFVDTALMGGRASLASKGEPIISLVGDDGVRFLVVVAGITNRRFGYVEIVVVEEACVDGSQVLVGYLENPNESILAWENEICGLYFETITIINEGRFKNCAIRKISLFSNPRSVCQPAEGFGLTLPANNSWQRAPNVLRIVVCGPE